MAQEEQGSWNKPLVANADQEAFVQARIISAIHMAIGVIRERRVQADDPIAQYAIRGIAEGAAFEIIGTLGMTPSHVNIRPYSSTGSLWLGGLAQPKL